MGACDLVVCKVTAASNRLLLDLPPLLTQPRLEDMQLSRLGLWSRARVYIQSHILLPAL